MSRAPIDKFLRFCHLLCDYYAFFRCFPARSAVGNICVGQRLKKHFLTNGDANHDYNSLSTLFSSVEGITIEKFIILQKVEWVKELLFYDELNLNEISAKAGYSSAQHLSSQFKKVTGMTPSYYKKLGDKPRQPLDRIG